ncbi:AQJ64_40280 family protein [Actinocatenispora sera]|uniref:AQJ64_40280 family protein n=1 Tax=Actinocatenispora sera TaxID=390989 RepID=UPI001B80CF75|nr:AQJ64_40280 family protein [Actinocatenispora sera]
MDAIVEWVDARDRLPESGWPVSVAATGRYPDGEQFWLVLASVFHASHRDEDGTEHRDCFVDSDGVVRLPFGRPCDEPVTHWAYPPALPGRSQHAVLGDEAVAAVATVLH